MLKNNLILAIESSCDETAASVYSPEHGVLSSKLYSQIELHKKFGGVVPELASRSHLEKINLIVQSALNEASVTLDEIETIAVTNKPGLPGSLLVGVCFAKALAFAKHKNIIGIDHLEAHIFSSFIENRPPFPHLCITASGGHTSLYLVEDYGKYKVISETLDDAAGECFDKVAKLINLPYPGGPVIEKLGQEANFEDFFKYPRNKNNSINFSFSGLKTAVLYDLVTKGAYNLETKTFLNKNDKELQKQVASSLLVCIKDIFLQKLKLALKINPRIKGVTFVGGVACNKYISKSLEQFCWNRGIEFYTPSPKYCTDNAAMVAFVASYKAKEGKFDNLSLDIF
ncbi:MAG: putative tRNA threonylcarbamoyladenosine biosynthesis protein Gcp [candidate division TM6 bacterium GW2011_GWF2_32_72]|nr:MAG: putative tRNA threonylcarbamoyladenosine biosynthesis protein Gcp [candidate division TM6 bacterium GW2011_GWF2_32_72]